MPYILIRIVRVVLLRRNLALPAIVGGFVFVTSWPLMWLAEPAGSALVRPENYWWWFLVTCSTVGYGDYFPTTPAGHVVGVYVIVGGIVTLTTVFAQFALVLERMKGRRMNGSGVVEDTGHVVVLGYLPGRTERLVEELLADGDGRVVLGAGRTSIVIRCRTGKSISCAGTSATRVCSAGPACNVRVVYSSTRATTTSR